MQVMGKKNDFYFFLAFNVMMMLGINLCVTKKQTSGTGTEAGMNFVEIEQLLPNLRVWTHSPYLSVEHIPEETHAFH